MFLIANFDIIYFLISYMFTIVTNNSKWLGCIMYAIKNYNKKDILYFDFVSEQMHIQVSQ